MERIIGFEVVADDKRRTEGALTLPKCATASSAAYDFYAPVDAVIAPMQWVMIWTDVKAYFPVDEVLLINVRSSMGKQPVMLANTQGWIDADYYGNPDNDGNIGLRLFNLGQSEYIIKRGDRIGQGMFVKTLRADQGDSAAKRLGGFGSTNQQ